jgi:hypothetical protein
MPSAALVGARFTVVDPEEPNNARSKPADGGQERKSDDGLPLTALVASEANVAPVEDVATRTVEVLA